MGGKTQLIPRKQAITRQAAIRLVLSLGLFVFLVGISTSLLYQTAISKADHERAEDLGQFYRTRLNQLERQWELQSRDFRVRIEYTRLLEHPETAVLNLQAFMTIQGGDRRFQYLHVEDKHGERLFSYGKDQALDHIPLPPDASSGYYYDPIKKNVYRVFIDQIWLGERGMGRIAVFFRIDNALLQQLATPGVTLTALYKNQPVASSIGERGIESPRYVKTDTRPSEIKTVPWNLDSETPVTITIRSPVKVLFSTTELALAVSVIPIFDALILWFTLGTWLMRQARRINELGAAVREFSAHNALTHALTNALGLAQQGAQDEIHEVAVTIEEMARSSEFREAERLRQEAQQRLWAMVFANSNEAILITDRENRIIAVNEAFTILTGYRADEVLGANPSILSAEIEDEAFYEVMWQQINETGSWQGEINDRRKDGTVYPKWLSIVAVKDDHGVISNFVGSFTDITERKASEARITHLATHDVLTGLPNRTMLLDRLDTAIARAQRDERMVGVMFLDLDRFKWVNDSLGHALGDLLLKEVAVRLKAALRGSDTVARLGGDEFIIVLDGIDDSGGISMMATKVINTIATPMHLDERELQITTSLGISIYPHDGATSDLLLKHADTAMYAAKASGKNQARFFDAEMNRHTLERFELERGLREALANEQFQLVFQPKHCLHLEVIGGAEALLRWNHPTLGAISPARFIPIAEETGLIIPIGEWVLRSTCRQIRAWHDAGIDNGVISVNVSAQQLESSNFTEVVVDVLEEFQLEPSMLELELTESAILHDPERSIVTLERLRQLGIKLSLDDFGTGYSSLAYLKRLPVDTIKIDRSFVDGLPNDEDDAQIVRMTVALAKSIGLLVVAEGVETVEQLNYLRVVGCDLAQGYYISRPIDSEQFAIWLKQTGYCACPDASRCGDIYCGPKKEAKVNG